MTDIQDRPAPGNPRKKGWLASPSTPADTAVTVSLAAMSLVAAAGLSRLFADRSFLLPVLFAAAAAHTVAWLGRRIGLGGLATIALGAATTVLLVTWTTLLHTTFIGLPTRGTWHGLQDATTSAWETFQVVVAPVPPQPGFTMTCVAAVAITAFLGDWAAFRLRATFEAVIPSFTVFAFTSVLGRGNRTLAAAAQLVVIVAFILVQRAAAQSSSAAWFAGRTRGAWSAVVASGAVFGAVAVIAAVVIGPNLPGAGKPPLVDYRQRDGSGPSSRATISPLVDIRGRIDDKTGLEVMTVFSDVGAYWRLTSLDRFDGNIWSSEDSYKPTRQRLEDVAQDQPGQRSITQTFHISKLSSIWLPAAFQPVRITGLGGVSYDPRSGSLISRSETTDGLTYAITSSLPELSPGELAGAPASDPSGELARFLELPSVPGRIRALADQIVSQGSNTYAKARLLQDFFQANFTYSLAVPPGHSDNALDRFLFKTRTGYCEQFAGAYAVMARLVGIPARVAVGFQAGTLEADGLWHVRDTAAHAWPEVYIEGHGWLAFEPTPGRGSGVTTSYTGIPEQQDNATPDPGRQTPTTLTPTTVAGSANPSTPGTTLPKGEQGNGGLATPTRQAGGTPWPLWVLLAILGFGAAYVIALPTLVRNRRHRRRRRAEATGDAGIVVVAWTEADEALARIDLGRHGHETPVEHARRVVKARGAGGVAATLLLPDEARSAVTELAERVTTASYAGGDMSGGGAESLAEAAVVEAAVKSRLTRSRRWRQSLDPHQVFSLDERRPRRRRR